MVISGMNLGLLTGPPLGGFIYDKAGYYAVFETILVIIAFDFFLRLCMVEKQSAMYWARHEDPEAPREEPISNPKLREEVDSSSNRIIAASEENQERAPLLGRTSKRSTSWVAVTFPTMHILMHSPRVLAAIGGSFTQTMLGGYILDSIGPYNSSSEVDGLPYIDPPSFMLCTGSQSFRRTILTLRLSQ